MEEFFDMKVAKKKEIIYIICPKFFFWERKKRINLFKKQMAY